MARTLLSVCLAGVFCCFTMLPARAAIVDLSTADAPFDAGVLNQGWWGFAGTNNNTDSNDSVLTGIQGNESSRSFFTFALAPLAPFGPTVVIQSAELRLQLYGASLDGFHPGFPAETFRVNEVTTDAATLNNNSGSSFAIYSDLGDGVVYGETSVANGPSSTDVIVSFNAAGISAIQTAFLNGDTYFSVGGSLPTTSNTNDFIFNNASPPATILRLEAVPEPSALALVGLGVVSTCLRRRRR